MSDTQTPTPEVTGTSARRPRTIAWGTTIAGAIALGLAVLIGLSEIAGLSIPFRTAGPGAVIVVGLVILLAGLAVVIRSGRSTTPTSSPGASGSAGAHSAPGAPAVTPQIGTSVSTPPPPPPAAGSPLDVPAGDESPAQSNH